MQFGLCLPEPGIEVMDLGESPVPVPAFVLESPPWYAPFLDNLNDLLWRAEQPRLRLASKPGEFWPDVFVAAGAPWGKFAQSVVLHAIGAGLVWATILLWPRPPRAADRPAFRQEDVIYYSASEYLPPLDTGGARSQLAKKGDPALAPQPILSVPPQSDNRTQTIVTPPDVKLNRDVPIPNVVSWAPRAAQVPIASISRPLAAPRANSLDVQVVAPTPDAPVTSSARRLEAPQAAVVEPAPTLDTSIRRTAELSIAPSQAVAPAPQLPMQSQRSARTLGNSAVAVVPPSPSVQNAGLSSSGERLIALGIHPIAVTGPVEAPAGNRRGTFAANPQGTAGAAGTPGTTIGAQPGGAAAGNRNSGNGAGAGKQGDVPPGLHVGAGPDAVNTSAVGGNGRGRGAGGDNGPASQAANRSVLMAKVEAPRASALPHSTSPSTHEIDSPEDQAIFGDRKFYALTLNMPNLNSGGGSWVIHFAELNENTDKSELSAPTPIAVADPAYPLQLMKENVKGTVTLYAVIHSDGSVSDVRVLRSSDDRLEPYARDAFARWHFHPATKSGGAVDLAAVVTVPFRPSKLRSGF